MTGFHLDLTTIQAKARKGMREGKSDVWDEKERF